MAKLASPETVRFTPAQRDALIDLATRLQAEHEATVGTEELVQAAAEAGVDPRFLSEAAARLESAPAASPPAVRDPLVALAALALFDFLFLGIVVRHWFFPIAPGLRLPLLLAAAFAFSTVCARHRALRWAAPLAPLGIWLSIGVASTVAYRLHGSAEWSTMPKYALGFGLVQAFGALLAAGVASLHDRPRNA